MSKPSSHRVNGAHARSICPSTKAPYRSSKKSSSISTTKPEKGSRSPMPQLILRNAALLDAAAPERREGMCVVIEGDRIREIAEIVPMSPGDEQIDLGGRTLMPGLI